MCFSFVLSINFCHFLIALFFLWLGLVVFGAIICVIKFLDFLLFPAFYLAKVFYEVAFEFWYIYRFHEICFVNFSGLDQKMRITCEIVLLHKCKFEFLWILTPSCILPSLHWSFSKTIKPFLENAIYRDRTLFLSCFAPCYETKPSFENIFHVCTY